MHPDLLTLVRITDLAFHPTHIECLYFGIREQKQILIIENRFIVFQNIPH